MMPILPVVYIGFGSSRAREGWNKMQPKMQELANEMAIWVFEKTQFHMVITETVTTLEQDNELQRVSTTHRDGRAIDVRIRDPLSGHAILTEDTIAKFCAYFRKKYPNLGATSKTTNNRELIVYKPHGSGPHLHIQIKRNA